MTSGEVDELSLSCIKLDGTGVSLGKQASNVSLQKVNVLLEASRGH